jgi:hypothetical protein
LSILKPRKNPDEKNPDTSHLKDIKDVVACVCDYGTFISVAEKLGEKMKKVYYYSPYESEYENSKEALQGTGLDNVERLDEFMDPDVFDTIDLFIFPDIGFNDLQKHLRSIGKTVWGSMGASELELTRDLFLEKVKSVGLPVIPYKKIVGLDALSIYLRGAKDKWIKINRYRENMETWHHIDYEHSKRRLDHFNVIFGPIRNELVFIVQDNIKSEVECYDKETEVLTNNGWKLFSDILPEDTIATLNRDTRELEYQKPTNTIKKFSHTIYKAKRQKIDLAITAEHNLAVIPKSNDTVRLLPLKKLSQHGYSIPASAIWNGNEKEFFILPSVAIGKSNSGEKIIRMDDWLEFLGWLQSDGCITKSENTVLISQSFVHSKERESIEKLLNRLPFHWNKNGYSFRITSKQLYLYLYPYTRKAEKRVPDFIKSLSSRQIRIFLDALFEGDGSTATNGKTKIYCLGNDKKLADDVQELLLKSGANGAVIKKKPQQTASYIGKRKLNRTKETYDVSEHSSKQYCIDKSDFKEYIYNDYVYCVTVPNHIIYVRRNGRALWCGNCGYDGWSVDGKYPSHSFQGYEKKNELYLGCVMSDNELPKEIKMVNEKMSPILEEYGYRDWWATEIRVAKGTPYFIDPTPRMPGQTGEHQLETIENFAEIIWCGANGILIEPRFKWKYAAEATLHYNASDKNIPTNIQWKTLDIPKDVRRWMKLYHYCKVKDIYHFFPSDSDEVGVMIGVGDSLEEAIQNLKDNMEIIKDLPVDADLYGFVDLLKSIEEANKSGITFGDGKVPDIKSII